MENPSADKLKAVVRKKYGEIARQKKPSSCCCGNDSKDKGSSCCGSGAPYSFMGEDYRKIPGHMAEADLGLGCGVPTELAKIKKGDAVLDLGSGAGNDAFIARRVVGVSGRVIGVDMTAEMVKRARANARKLGFRNVDFVLGEIESLPVPDRTADVIISNCVLNLVPDKQKAFREIFRALKPGGRFTVSDIVLNGELPEKIKSQAELYAGCVAGAAKRKEYLDFIRKAGFKGIKVLKDRRVEIPREILLKVLTEKEWKKLEKSGVGIFSVTVTGTKP